MHRIVSLILDYVIFPAINLIAMKIVSFIIVFLASLGTVVPSKAQVTYPDKSPTGVIRVISNPKYSPGAGFISFLPPVMFDLEVMQMALTPAQLLYAEVDSAGVQSFPLVSMPALYSYSNSRGAAWNADVLAMPGDTILVDYRNRGSYAEVTGPKVTVDYYNMSCAVSKLYKKFLAVKFSEGATQDALDKAEAEFQAGVKELFLANTDNAGAICALKSLDRKEWNELLPMISKDVYEHPLLYPTYLFMDRCVKYSMTFVPGKFEV